MCKITTSIDTFLSYHRDKKHLVFPISQIFCLAYKRTFNNCTLQYYILLDKVVYCYSIILHQPVNSNILNGEIVMQHILVTTDFSEAAESAFDYAKRQLKLTGKENNKITLLKVIDIVPPANIKFEYGLAIADKKGMLEKLHKQASDRIREIAEKHFAGLPVNTVVIRPKKAVYQEITNFAKTNNVDLIVMSTHGRTGVKHFLLGSVAERVVRRSQCPVMVVPTKILKK
jgi:nucleotide-binding universal stress UspA family protein